ASKYACHASSKHSVLSPRAEIVANTRKAWLYASAISTALGSGATRAASNFNTDCVTGSSTTSRKSVKACVVCKAVPISSRLVAKEGVSIVGFVSPQCFCYHTQNARMREALTMQTNER